MFLTRLILNQRDRQARRDLADCHALHRTILSAFPATAALEKAREQFGVLHRLDINPRTGSIALLVQSNVAGDWSRLPGGYLACPPEHKDVTVGYGNIQSGQQLRFRLRVNPTKRVGKQGSANRPEWKGKRVDLRGEQDQLDWLTRKAAQYGFRVLGVRSRPDMLAVDAAPQPRATGVRDGKRLTFGAVVFEGVLEVADAERFCEALAGGIGSGKAYGFGLLSIATAKA